MDVEGLQVGVQVLRIYLEISNIDFHTLKKVSVSVHITESKD